MAYHAPDRAPRHCPPAGERFEDPLGTTGGAELNEFPVGVPAGDQRAPGDIPDSERDYFLERRYPSFGNLVPRDIASRSVKAVCDQGRGVGPGGLGVYLDLGDAVRTLGARAIEERYGNLFEMYQRITDERPPAVPMRIYPAIHYTMGGLWVDYALMSTIPGGVAVQKMPGRRHVASALHRLWRVFRQRGDDWSVSNPRLGNFG